jgi:aryl-alcohol dehydrogenase-like predicted oxidoreductase
MIDTADVYSAWVPGHQGGESERLIGRWLKRDPAKRDKIVIATKVGFLDGEIVDGEYVAALQPEGVLKACDASLERMGIDTIDLYYQHRDNPAVPLADSLGAFDELRKAGRIRAIGLSNFTADRLELALATSRDNGFAAPAALQPWYNLVERGKYEDELQAICVAHNVSVFPYYSLANGFLTGKYRSKDDLGKSSRGLRSADYLEGKGMRVLAALDAVAADTGASLATVALAWTKVQPGITAPIASATSLDQFKDLAAALTLDLTPEQVATLDSASA